MTALVLDSQALSVLARRPSADKRVVRAALRAALSSGGGVILTGDVSDIAAIADGLSGITVESIR